MPYRYGRAWHDALRKPIAEIQEPEARRRWQHGPPFSVSKVAHAEGNVVPEFTLVVGSLGTFVKCFRYRATGSVHTIASFRPHDDRLFLSEVVAYAYPEAQRLYSQMDAVATSVFQFRPDGWARRRFAVHGEPEAHVSEYADVDVQAHWEPMLEFGDWDRFGMAREPGLGSDR